MIEVGTPFHMGTTSVSGRTYAGTFTSQSPLCLGYSLMAWVIFALLLLPNLAIAQQQNGAGQPTDEQLLRDFMAKSPGEILADYFRSPPYPIFAIRRLMDIGDPVVIPRLEQAFKRERREPAQEFLAAALVDLGDPKPEYFDFVAARAEVAVTSDLPFPIQLGSHIRPGASLPPFKNAFLTWVRRHDVDLNTALGQAAFDMPGTVEALGEADDLRSRPIFLRGLKSPNVLVVFAAALGLARLQDNKAVPSIIVAAKRERYQERRMVAKTLLYFSTPKAQHAADRLIGDSGLTQHWRAEVKKRGWRNAMRDGGQ